MRGKPKHRAGFVAIAGKPNAGKSTLLNALIGEKLAITAPQAQTTRTAIQGVVSTPDAQIVFLDTPGIHKSDTLFNKRMMETVRGALRERDLVLFVADASKPLDTESEHAVSALAGSDKTLLILSKIDRVADKRGLLPLMESYGKLFPFFAVVPVSARTGDGLEELKKLITENLPVSPSFFPEDHLTDQPMRFLAGEIIREKVLRTVRQEVPHAVAVLVDTWEEKRALTRIAATIYVERTGQKAILVGQGGQVLKKIGTEARVSLEGRIGHKVFLSLFVKVKPKWREDPQFLTSIDWRAMAGRDAGEQ